MTTTITKLTLYLILFILPLGQLTRLPIAGGDVAVYLNDILLPLMLLFWLSYSLAIRKKLFLPPLATWIFVFVAIAFISLVNGVRYVGLSHSLVGGLYLWRFVMYASVYFVVYDLNRVTKGSFTGNIVKLLLFGQAIFATLGLLQFVFFPDFSKFVTHGWDPHYYRVLSTFFDPNFAGIFLLLGLSLTLALWSFGRLRFRLLHLSSLTLMISAIILTFSRSTYLAFLIIIGIFGLLRSRYLLLIMVLISLMAFAFIPRVQQRVVEGINLDQTARARLVDWSKTFTVIQDHPILGVGFNTLRYIKDQYGFFRDERGVNQPGGHSGAGSDSSLLFVWATSGIFGLIAYLGLLLSLWWQGWQSYKQGQGLAQALGLTLVVIIPTLLLESWFINSLFYPWIMLWTWVIAGSLKFKAEKEKI